MVPIAVLLEEPFPEVAKRYVLTFSWNLFDLMGESMNALSSLPVLHYKSPGEATQAMRPGPSDHNRQCSSLTMLTLHGLIIGSLE